VVRCLVVVRWGGGDEGRGMVVSSQLMDASNEALMVLAIIIQSPIQPQHCLPHSGSIPCTRAAALL